MHPDYPYRGNRDYRDVDAALPIEVFVVSLYIEVIEIGPYVLIVAELVVDRYVL